MWVSRIMQGLAAICIAVGVALWYYGQSIVPNLANLDPLKLNQAVQDTVETSSAYKAFGAGCFTLGVLALILMLLNRLGSSSGKDKIEFRKE